MFDVYLGDIELTEVIIFLSILVVLPLQLFLCFKAKKQWIKLLPISTFIVLIAFFLCLANQNSIGWDGIGYLILAIFAGILLAASVVGWIIWFIIKLVKKKKQI